MHNHNPFGTSENRVRVLNATSILGEEALRRSWKLPV